MVWRCYECEQPRKIWNEEKYLSHMRSHGVTDLWEDLGSRDADLRIRCNLVEKDHRPENWKELPDRPADRISSWIFDSLLSPLVVASGVLILLLVLLAGLSYSGDEPPELDPADYLSDP